MPAITPGSKILVTGANGYVAVWVVKTLLERGFSVRATVRSESKAGHLNSLFSSYGDKYETVVVEDITKVCLFIGWNEVRYELLVHLGWCIRRGRQRRFVIYC